MSNEKYYCDGCGEHESIDDDIACELNDDGSETYTCIICGELCYTAAELGFEEDTDKRKEVESVINKYIFLEIAESEK